jgi:hypothetical protein
MTTAGFLYPGVLEDARQADNDEMLAMREKYYKLLEEHNLLLKSYSSLKDALELAKKDIIQLRKQVRSKKST